MEPELAKEAIKQIAKIYKLEKISVITSLYSYEIPAYRQKFSEPIVDALFIWFYEQRQILPINPSK